MDPAGRQVMAAGRRARLYDWECRHVLGRTDQDVDFWLDVARRAAGPVLELACGTGRVTRPLRAAGIDVIGLDVDPAMLAGAQQAPFPRLLLIAADMRRFALARRFAAVIIPYNSFQLLIEPQDAVSCLRHIRAHLAPGGLFGLEVTDFQAGAVHGEVPDQPIGEGCLDGAPMTLSGSLSHDFDRRVSEYGRRFNGPDWKAEDMVAIRSYNRDELNSLLVEAGFVPYEWWQQDAATRVIARPRPS